MVEKPDLTMEQLTSLLEAAKKESVFDYAALLTMVALNLRRGSLVGQNDPRSSPNPGLLIENLTEDGIRVFEKHGPKDGILKPVPPVLRSWLKRVIENRTTGRIFPRTTGWVWYRIQRYAEKAGLSKERIKPNTLSDFSEYHDAHLFEILKLDGQSHKLERAKQPEQQIKDPRIVGMPINIPGLTYAPVNEQGVVLLWGLSCRALGFYMEEVRQGFPDAEAIDYRKDRRKGVSKKIEFEFKSSNFSRQRGHAPERCDIIVCWEHDWKNCPKEVEVIELQNRVEELRHLLPTEQLKR